jgi:hypothetical protein
MRDISGSVVPGQHAIARSRPYVVAGVVGQRKGRRKGSPPASRVSVDRLELHGVPDGSHAATRHTEGDDRKAAVVGQREGAVVELTLLERVRRASFVRTHRRADT